MIVKARLGWSVWSHYWLAATMNISLNLDFSVAGPDGCRSVAAGVVVVVVNGAALASGPSLPSEPGQTKLSSRVSSSKRDRYRRGNL